MTNEPDENTDADPDVDLEPELDDADLANLLAEHNDHENVERTADLVATFYIRLRKRIDPVLTSAGDIHDVALEITREWMTYTIGEV